MKLNTTQVAWLLLREKARKKNISIGEAKKRLWSECMKEAYGFREMDFLPANWTLKTLENEIKDRIRDRAANILLENGHKNFTLNQVIQGQFVELKKEALEFVKEKMDWLRLYERSAA